MTLPTPPHSGLQPSPWIQRWTHLIAAGGKVLDVACGSGRHLHWFAQLGFQVLGVDRDLVALQTASAMGPTLLADLEGQPWPLLGQQFDAVVVTNYLWRPLLVDLLASLAPGGVLLYETFAAGQASVGRPARPEFLLQNGELLRLCEGLRVVAYEDGFLPAPERFVQRIVAVRPGSAPAAAAPWRYPL